MLNKDTKIVHQGVDTLVTSHKVLHDDSYQNLFLPFLTILDKLKQEAQLLKGFDKKSRFVIYDFPILGRTKIYAQGGGRYSYQLENQDAYIEVSEADLDSDTPQIRVRYSNEFLFYFGALGAYKKVMDFILYVCGETKNLISEIHLCTDVAGVIYEQDDKLRFQTRLNASEYEEMRLFTSFNHVKGLYFGKGSFLFRIYDKNIDLRNHPEHAFVKQVWYLNGYSEFETDIVKQSVYRHEIQYRREYLKKYISELDDEPLYFFENLSKLWFHVLDKILFVNLTDDEVVRVKTHLNQDSIRQIFYRAKKDTERFDFWSLLATWCNDIEGGSLDMYPAFREAKISTLRKKIKEVVSLTFRNGLTMTDLKNLVAEVDVKMREFDGITLEQYGHLKVVDSFAHNHRLAQKFSVEAPSGTAIAQMSYDELTQAFVNFDVLSSRREYRSANKILGGSYDIVVKV